MKKILFIGGTGWLGHAFFKYITKKKNNKKLKFFSISRNEKLTKLREVNYIFKDINNINKLQFYDYIIYGLDIYSSQLTKFLNLINSKKFKQSKIFYLSSGSVYGNLKANKQIEKCEIKKKNINFSNNFKKKYALRKIKSEKTIIKFSEKGFDFTILRLFNLVGPNIPQKKNFAIGNFIKNILEKKPIISTSDRLTVRGYLHTDTFSELLLKLFKNKEKKNKIYNIGSSKKIQIDKLVKKLSKEYNLKFNFKKKINLKKRPDIYIVNNKKLKRKFKNFKYIEGYPAIIKTIRILKKEKSIH